MDRVLVSFLCVFLVYLLLPQSWASQHYACYLLIVSGVFPLGFFIYKPTIVRNNIHHFHRRWIWYMKDRNDFRWVTGVSWLTGYFALFDVRMKPLKTFGLWVERVLVLQALLLGAASLVFIASLIIADDIEEMPKEERWHLEGYDKRRMRDGFQTLLYSFPFGLVYLGFQSFRHRREIWACLTDGLREQAAKHAIPLEVIDRRYSIPKITYLLGRILVWLLMPTLFRLPVLLSEVVIMLAYARITHNKPLPYALLGILIGTLHVTAGYRLSYKLREALKIPT